MQNIRNIAMAGLLLLTATGSVSGAEATFLSTPSNFQVMAVSANGKWACGVFLDAYNNTYGFRWNLLSGTIEILDAVNTNMAWAVADNGTVSGDFGDTSVSANGAPVAMPGYYKDGRWNSVEYPQGAIGDGMGCGISPDGQYMVGSVQVNGVYKPYIWRNGELYRSLSTNSHGVAYAVAPDGQSAAGWSMQYNRTACIWNADNTVNFFEDSKDHSQSPWNAGKNFSPDGRKLLYWGGWDIDESDNIFLYTLYDVETGERTKVPSTGIESTLEFFGISNSTTLVGQDKNRGYVYSDGRGMYVDEYLQLRGVDMSKFNGFYTGEYYQDDNLPITNVVSISGDDSVIAMWYWDKQGLISSLIVKVDQDASQCPPAEVTGHQLDGLSTVALSWKAPVGVSGIRGYNVYRDGRKLNGFLPLNALSFYDTAPAAGTYTYTVALVGANGQEIKADDIQVSVEDALTYAPQNLFGRQRGINNALLSWDAPLPNKPNKRYYNDLTGDLDGFYIYDPITVQTGIRIDKAEAAHYSGYSIDQVSFVPMSDHDAWRIKVFQLDEHGAPTLIASQDVTQTLQYRRRNTVTLDTPVALPAADIVVAVEVDVDEDAGSVIGVQSNRCRAGYSDLMRKADEERFYSAYDSSVASGYSLSCLSWAIDFSLTGADYAPSRDVVDHYDIYVDGDMVAQTTERTCSLQSLDDGSHSVGVTAIYADGRASDVTGATIDIAAAYVGVDHADITVGDDVPTVTATWDTPIDNDRTEMSYYVSQQNPIGVKGPQSQGYALMAAVEYDSQKLRGYDGYRIESLNFLPLTDAIYTFYLYLDGQMQYELEVEDYTIGAWNTIAVPDEIIIDETRTYRLAIDCFDPIPDTDILGVDAHAGFAYKSDLVSLDNGETWESISADSGMDGNWLMSMTLTDTAGVEADVLGYDVRINGIKANKEMLTTREFSKEFSKFDNSTYRFRVDTYYPGVAKAVNGAVQIFVLEAAGIDDAITGDVELLTGDGTLTVTGDDVHTVRVYDTNGMLVAASQTDTVATSAMSTGVYIVSAVASGRQVTFKVAVNR